MTGLLVSRVEVKLPCGCKVTSTVIDAPSTTLVNPYSVESTLERQASAFYQTVAAHNQNGCHDTSDVEVTPAAETQLAEALHAAGLGD